MFFCFWSQLTDPPSSQPAESLRDKMIRETETALSVKLASDRRFARRAISGAPTLTTRTRGDAGVTSV
ncbi:MAG: hypothetical protein U1A77_08860 [Pirellulales bacterium]